MVGGESDLLRDGTVPQSMFEAWTLTAHPTNQHRDLEVRRKDGSPYDHCLPEGSLRPQESSTLPSPTSGFLSGGGVLRARVDRPQRSPSQTTFPPKLHSRFLRLRDRTSVLCYPRLYHCWSYDVDELVKRGGQRPLLIEDHEREGTSQR